MVTGARGFAFARGDNLGIGTLRAFYQNKSKAVNLTVGQLTGIDISPPLSQIYGYVRGQATEVKIFGQFADGQTVNITPAADLESQFGGTAFGTGVDYNLRADVANSFALITGQSAAAGDVLFIASGSMNEFGATLTTAPFAVNWCWFNVVFFSPQNPQIQVGTTIKFSLLGRNDRGRIMDALAVNPGGPAFTSRDESIAVTNPQTMEVRGISPGQVTLDLSIYNGPGDFCRDGLSTSTTVTVVAP